MDILALAYTGIILSAINLIVLFGGLFLIKNVDFQKLREEWEGTAQEEPKKGE